MDFFVPRLGAFRAELGASEQLRPHQAAHARGGLRQQLCARPRAHSGFTEHTERHRGEQHLR